MRSKSILVVVMVFLFCLKSNSSAATPSFQGLGDLPGGPFMSWAEAISGDSTVVVGYSQNQFSHPSSAAFRWTETGGIQSIGAPTGSRALDVSASGSGFESLGWLLGTHGSLFSYASTVSADGSIIIGSSSCESRWSQAFRWTESEGMQALNISNDMSTWGQGISADGTVVVGKVGSLASHEAYRWTESGGIQTLGVLPGGSNSDALAVSANGLVVVGYSGAEAFRWTETLGIQTLGGGFMQADAVSADGSFIAGRGSGLSGYEAFIWDEDNGSRNLNNLLPSLGLDLTDWNLVYAEGISDDGLSIVGWGINPEGNQEAWIATVPEPATLLLLGLGAVMLRRKQ